MALFRCGDSKVDILPAVGKYYEVTGSTKTENDIPANGVITKTSGLGYIIVNCEGYSTVTNGGMEGLIAIGVVNDTAIDVGSGSPINITNCKLICGLSNVGHTLTLAV